MRYIRALQVRFGPDAAPGAGYLAAERRYAAAMEAVAEAEPQVRRLPRPWPFLS